MPAKAANLKLLVAEVALSLLLVGAAEAALRFYVARPDARLYPNLFPSPLTTAKYFAYRRLESAGEPLDILLMGMSQMAQLGAANIARIVAEREQRTVTAFNFAAPGHTVRFDDRLLEDVLVKIKRPTLILYGVIPTNLIMEPEGSGGAGDALSPVFAAYAETPAGAVRRALLHDLDLVLYREAIRDELSGGATRATVLWTAMARKIGASGDMPPVVGRPKPMRRANPWEQENLGTRFREFDALMENTELFDHLEALARSCRRLGIHLALLANPVSPVYVQLLPNGIHDYRRFRDRLRQTADAAGIPLLDPAPDGLGDPELFTDATHNTEAGVSWLSEEIATFLLEYGRAGERRPSI